MVVVVGMWYWKGLAFRRYVIYDSIVFVVTGRLGFRRDTCFSKQCYDVHDE